MKLLSSSRTAAVDTDHVIMAVFLRGAMDGLSYVVPGDDPDYQAARPTLAIPSGALHPLDDRFGLSPNAAALLPLWEAGKVAFVPASGSLDDSRSHFEAMANMELSTPEDQADGTGWLGRLVDATATGAALESVGIGKVVPRSLLGGGGAIGLADLASFRFGSLRGEPASEEMRAAVAAAFDHADDPVTATGADVFGVLDVLASEGLDGAPTPEEFGSSSIGADLWQAAQLINADVGVRVLAADHGGWDHHDGLGTVGSGRMRDQLLALSAAVAGFWEAIADHHDRVTMVIQTEFGRRVAENSNGGTDHGHGGVLTVIGGGIAGGVHGDWAGLGADVLDRGDVPVLTDYRRVLGEIIDRRVGAGAAVADVFPGAGPLDYVGVTAA